MAQLNEYLSNEQTGNMKAPWNKLSTMTKRTKLADYANAYAATKHLTEPQRDVLHDFLLTALERKRLSLVKNVTYDRTAGTIRAIPALAFDPGRSHFTLTNTARRTSTTRNLGPRKKAPAPKEKDEQPEQHPPQPVRLSP
jgi:hypothetical protein